MTRAKGGDLKRRSVSVDKVKIVILLFGLLSLTLNGALLTLEKGSATPIEEAIEYFEDINGDFDYRQVQNERFTPYAKDRSINFGFTRSTYWFKINLHNLYRFEDSKWWLKIDYPLLKSIDLYLLRPEGTLIKHCKMGTSIPYASREIDSHNFISELPLHSIPYATVLIRVKTESSMQLPITILATEAMVETIERNMIFVGLYYGIFFIVFLYNAVLFIYSKDYNYLRYIVFLTSFILWQLSFDGLGIQYLWGESEWMIQHGSAMFIALTSFSALYFSRHFLNTPLYTPRIDTVIIMLMVVSIVMIIASSIFPYAEVIVINAFLASIMPVVLLSAGLSVMRHEFRAARFYVAGWSSFLIATIIFAFNKFDLIPSFYGINNVQQIGSAIEMIFLSLALADRVYLLQREYIEKLNRLNETLVEKVQSALNEARLKDRLFVQQSRLAAMGEMIEQIAHQWRQPLNTLALINQDMYVKQKLGINDEKSFDENHQRIDEHLQYLSKTIDDFRNFYKTDKSKSLEDVGALAAEALKLSDVFLNYAKIKTSLEVSTHRSVSITKNEMIQVLMNLIKNAHDAIVSQKLSEGKIEIRVEEVEGGVRISVEDNAGGISPNVIDKIFDIYFTTKDPDKRSGLGLHMSKYIIEESFGGTIRAENANGGARFLITLPIDKENT